MCHLYPDLMMSAIIQLNFQKRNSSIVLHDGGQSMDGMQNWTNYLEIMRNRLLLVKSYVFHYDKRFIHLPPQNLCGTSVKILLHS